MTNSLSDILLAFSHQETITLHDAINALLNYIHRYQVIFDKMLKIRMDAPIADGESSFRRTQFTDSDQYKEIQRLLQKFQDYLIKFNNELVRLSRHPEYIPEYQQRLLTNLDKYIQSLQKLYQGKSTSFASVLNDAIALQNVFLQKLNGQLQEQHSDKQSIQEMEAASNKLSAGEKFVYVRIFHRLMPTLATKQGSYSWVKPLLESVKQAEKHGFGVYANEEEIIKSLKDEHYGYVTLKINETQDISHQRAEKICPIVGCSLLTITNIEIDNMVRLTHQNVSFEIRESVLYR